jgi:hypothetical protein
MFFKKCRMPDLSALLGGGATSTFLIHRLLNADERFPTPMASYRRNFVRLADKAVRDYSEVRNAVEAQINEAKRPATQIARQGRFIYVYLISDKLEDCIVTVRRLFRYFERIKSDPSRFPIDRLFKRQVAALEKDVVDIRDLIEHLDEEIRSETVLSGQNTAAALDDDAATVVLAGAKLPASALARCIQHFHSFAKEFAQYRIAPNGTYERIPKSGPVRANAAGAQ